MFSFELHVFGLNSTFLLTHSDVEWIVFLVLVALAATLYLIPRRLLGISPGQAASTVFIAALVLKAAISAVDVIDVLMVVGLVLGLAECWLESRAAENVDAMVVYRLTSWLCTALLIVFAMVVLVPLATDAGARALGLTPAQTVFEFTFGVLGAATALVAAGARALLLARRPWLPGEADAAH